MHERAIRNETLKKVSLSTPGLRAYQFPTVDFGDHSVCLMVQLRCICGAKIVNAAQSSRIPRSGCRFDLWNPVLQPRTHRQPDSAERSAARLDCCLILGGYSDRPEQNSSIDWL